jgi:hypothetical protein
METATRAGRRGVALKRVPRHAARLAGEHWLFLLFLVAGAALRAIATFAYRPAIFGPDSYWYLERSVALLPPVIRPIGYPAFLRVLPLGSGLEVVAIVQHVIGLLIAGLLYALLARLGLRRRLAALATAPVLLDAYQINVEEQILSEALFELLLVGALVALLWKRPLGIVPAGLAGALLAAATLTRGIALFVLVPAALAALFLGARPSRWLALAALVASFGIPMAAYAAWFHSYHGRYALTTYQGRFLYGRASTFADCDEFSVPAFEKRLCPDRPPASKLTVAQLLWSRARSPLHRVNPPPGETNNDVAGDFAKRAMRNQPLAYFRVLGRDFIFFFSPVKRGRPGEFGVAQWRFQRTYPIYKLGELCPPPGTAAPREPTCTEKRERTDRIIRSFGGSHGRVNKPLASFLHGYQRFAYTPGPLLAAALLAGLLAALGLGRAHGSGLRTPAFLFSGAALVISLGSIALTVFSWRYQLPQVILLPTAAALALSAFTRKPDEVPSPDSAASSDGAGPSSAPAEAPKPVC